MIRIKAAVKAIKSWVRDRGAASLFFAAFFVLVGLAIQLTTSSVQKLEANQDRNYNKVSTVLVRVEDLQLQNNRISEQLKVYAQCLADLEVRSSQGQVLTSADIVNCNTQASKATATLSTASFSGTGASSSGASTGSGSSGTTTNNEKQNPGKRGPRGPQGPPGNNGNQGNNGLCVLGLCIGGSLL